MKRSVIEIDSSDSDDFEDLSRVIAQQSRVVAQEPRAKRTLSFGSSSINQGDSHRPDSCLPPSSSGVPVKDRRILSTPEWTATVKWYPKVPTSKAWIDRKLRAETEDMRMTAKPPGCGDGKGCWLFEVKTVPVMLLFII